MELVIYIWYVDTGTDTDQYNADTDTGEIPLNADTYIYTDSEILILIQIQVFSTAKSGWWTSHRDLVNLSDIN
jgi:hypothetical protein